MNETFEIKPIGRIHTPFKQKFGVPRQSGLVATEAVIKFIAPYDCAEAFNGLDKISHIWLTFVFHKHLDAKQKLSVRPPRFGGNAYYGVFATRSSFRPNALGQSLVRVKEIVEESGKVSLLVEGADLIDGTPIVDIKPYLPYSDCVIDAVNDLAPQSPLAAKLEVEFLNDALLKISTLAEIKDDVEIIRELLALDPRPAYQKDEARQYGFIYKGYDVRWVVQHDKILVTEIEKKGDHE